MKKKREETNDENWVIRNGKFILKEQDSRPAPKQGDVRTSANEKKDNAKKFQKAFSATRKAETRTRETKKNRNQEEEAETRTGRKRRQRNQEDEDKTSRGN